MKEGKKDTEIRICYVSFAVVAVVIFCARGTCNDTHLFFHLSAVVAAAAAAAAAALPFLYRSYFTNFFSSPLHSCSAAASNLIWIFEFFVAFSFLIIQFFLVRWKSNNSINGVQDIMLKIGALISTYIFHSIYLVSILGLCYCWWLFGLFGFVFLLFIWAGPPAHFYTDCAGIDLSKKELWMPCVHAEKGETVYNNVNKKNCAEKMMKTQDNNNN